MNLRRSNPLALMLNFKFLRDLFHTYKDLHKLSVQLRKIANLNLQPNITSTL